MTNAEHFSVGVSGQHKIKAEHLQRLACIYVRQSSFKQVEQNRESQINQYQLSQRAQALGWHPERIRVIDTDQGLSGQGSAYRSGFKELVSEVSLGHVGIIFGYEVSRLARNNSDWYHLLDLAALFNTLIADNDGVYDPRSYNDRLLLGLKGTMSEAELHLLRQRLDAGRLSQVRRGVYRQRLPTGLVRLADGSVVKDPDDQVRHTLELVFAKFEELGSCHRVLRYLCQEHILLPRCQRSGLNNGELLWKPPSSPAIYAMLCNPAYAGAFAHGRRQVDPMRRQPGRPGTGLTPKPIAEWIHLERDVYPAYISWEQYLANQDRLHQNATRFSESSQGAQGAAREGEALLQGLVRCGACGHAMRVDYKRFHRYVCKAMFKDFGRRACPSMHGPSIDAAVVQAFFEALRPAQLDALSAVLAQQQRECQLLAQQWAERMKRARYEAQRAERQYQAVDPDNRLVAAELERRWEEKLRQLQETQEAYERFQQTPTPSRLTPELRQQFLHISETLPELWPTLANPQKKELLRSLIARVIVKKEAPDRIEVRIVWISEHYSILYVRPPLKRQEEVPRYEEMVQQIHTLWQQGFNDKQIAEQLSAEGFHSALSATVTLTAVKHIRWRHGWHLQLARSYIYSALAGDGYLTVQELATRLDIHIGWVYRRVREGSIDDKYVTRPPQSPVYLIRDDPELMAQLQLRKAASRQLEPMADRAQRIKLDTPE